VRTQDWHFFCSARLRADNLESSRCPPEGGRYMNQNRVLTRTLRPYRVWMVRHLRDGFYPPRTIRAAMPMTAPPSTSHAELIRKRSSSTALAIARLIVTQSTSAERPN
jgi:hypothetical protein